MVALRANTVLLTWCHLFTYFFGMLLKCLYRALNTDGVAATVMLTTSLPIQEGIVVLGVLLSTNGEFLTVITPATGPLIRLEMFLTAINVTYILL